MKLPNDVCLVRCDILALVAFGCSKVQPSYLLSGATRRGKELTQTGTRISLPTVAASLPLNMINANRHVGFCAIVY